MPVTPAPLPWSSSPHRHTFRIWVLLALLLEAGACKPANAPAPAAPAADAGLATPSPTELAAAATAVDAGAAATAVQAAAPGLALKPFGSAEAFAAYTRDVVAKRQRGGQRGGGLGFGGMGAGVGGAGQAMEAASVASKSLGKPSITGLFSGDGAGSITNNQEAGVDEGDIVKARGNHLIVLRRGRLFSIDLSGAAPKAVGAIDVAERLDPAKSATGDNGSTDAWYDELLVDGNTALVIGYAYGSGGTEVRSFTIDDAGQFQRAGTAVLRSQDYYSSHNYASRLIKHTLVMYVPIPLLQGWGDDAQTQLPAQRRAEKGQPPLEGAWTDLIEHEHLFQPIQQTNAPMVHAVVRCDVREPQITCTADALIGPSAHTFYVSAQAVYLWVGAGMADPELAPTKPDAAGGVCYRIPLNGTAPTAARVWGQPLDQLSFSEQPDGSLQVLVQRQGGADGMWRADWPQGKALALVKLPPQAFTPEGGAANPQHYQLLPGPGEAQLQNRFVGDWLLYGASQDWFGDRRANKPPLYLVHRASGKVAQVPLTHGADRIEVLGTDAVVVGARATDLAVTSIALGGDSPQASGHYLQKGAAQSESRTHGFYFLPSGPGSGVLGLPIVTGGESEHVFGGLGTSKTAEQRRGTAQVLFLSVKDLQLRLLGSLEAGKRSAHADDRCQASCTDWYGNARPIFWGGQILALLGYELIKAELSGERLQTAGQLDYWAGHPLRGALVRGLK